MKSTRITAVNGVGTMLDHAVVDVTLDPDQRFMLAFDDNLAADLVGAIASAGAINLAAKAKAKKKVNPPLPIESERLGFYASRANPDRMIVAVTVKEGITIPFTLPRASAKSLIENLQAMLGTDKTQVFN